MSLYDKVVDIICDVTGIEENQINRDSHIVNDLQIDSFSVVEILTRFESEFDINCDTLYFNGVYIIEDIVNTLEELGATVNDSSGSGSSGNVGGNTNPDDENNNTNSGGDSSTSNLSGTFNPDLLTTSPYPNIKMFKEGFEVEAYIYTDENAYKPSEDGVIFLYCSDQDMRDPRGATTLAIYFDDTGGDPDAENYYPYSLYQPAFYRGRVKDESGEMMDMWEMYEYNFNDGSCVRIMQFSTKIITVDSTVVVEFFDFLKYCPKLDILYREKLDTLHSVDAMNRFGCNIDNTVSVNSSSKYTSYTYNGTSYLLFRMDGYVNDGMEKNFNATKIGSYDLYMGSSTNTQPAILTPFEYRGGHFCKKNILSSYISPQTNNGGIGTNYGTRWKSMLLPEFIFKSEGSDGFGLVEITKLYGPYECDVFEERILIVWDRVDNIVKPKYLLIYFNSANDVISNIGSGLYGQPLKKIIEIE